MHCRLNRLAQVGAMFLLIIVSVSHHVIAQVATSEPAVVGSSEIDPQSSESGARPNPTSVDSLETLYEYAQAESMLPFVPVPPLPPRLADLTYEQFREISFKNGAGTWPNSNSPFWLESFHRGFVQTNRVDLYKLEGEGAKLIPFSSDDFEYGEGLEDLQGFKGLGHAGLRIAGRFPGKSDGQEMLTFLGSSYFRGRSAETINGSSTRGLALNIAMNQPEQFPAFRKFWVRRPATDQNMLEILGFLDSQSVCGAYRFEFWPGNTSSVMRVKARLFFRDVVDKVAIAPMTSMWMWGDGLKGPKEDKRPSVHDSDGLLMQTEEAGWIWRPYARQSYPSVSFRAVRSLKAFGILQRNRAFYHYDDHNARYDLRPGIWITPAKPWKNGRVELLELPGAHEGIDNIAAYWVADKPVDPETPLDLDYHIEFLPGDPGALGDLARANFFEVNRGSDIGIEIEDEVDDDASEDGKSKSDKQKTAKPRTSTNTLDISDDIEIKVRFSGQRIANLAEESSVLADVRTRGARFLKSTVERTDTNDWLVAVRFRLPPARMENGVAQPRGPVDVEVTLRDPNKDPDGKPVGNQLSETFWYLCPSAPPEFDVEAILTRQE